MYIEIFEMRLFLYAFIKLNVFFSFFQIVYPYITVFIVGMQLMKKTHSFGSFSKLNFLWKCYYNGH